MNAVADLFSDMPAIPARGFSENRRPGYSSLGGLLAPDRATERFCAWRGRSGGRYVASIYSFADCPDYEHVVALAVRRAADGTRTVLAGLDLGAFPIVALNGATMMAAREQGANEVHLHLLAETELARTMAIADLV